MKGVKVLFRVEGEKGLENLSCGIAGTAKNRGHEATSLASAGFIGRVFARGKRIYDCK
jgi:hypothetical protein